VTLFLLDDRLRVETLLDFVPSTVEDFSEFSVLRLLVDTLLDVAFGLFNSKSESIFLKLDGFSEFGMLVSDSCCDPEEWEDARFISSNFDNVLSILCSEMTVEDFSEISLFSLDPSASFSSTKFFCASSKTCLTKEFAIEL